MRTRVSGGVRGEVRGAEASAGAGAGTGVGVAGWLAVGASEGDGGGVVVSKPTPVGTGRRVTGTGCRSTKKIEN